MSNTDDDFFAQIDAAIAPTQRLISQKDQILGQAQTASAMQAPPAAVRLHKQQGLTLPKGLQTEAAASLYASRGLLDAKQQCPS
jgi:hypothetical protein